MNYSVEYLTLRNISPKNSETLIYRGVAPITAILEIPTDKNVRDAITKSTKLKKEMQESIDTSPEQFLVKNGGITVLAKSVQVHDHERDVVLTDPSIINGAQTQDVGRWWLETRCGEDDTLTAPLIQFEVLVTKDEELEREVSVSRNSVHKVNVTSIVGYRGGFDDLVANVDTNFALKETDNGEDPLKLLQAIELLTYDKPWSTYCSKAGTLSRYVKASPQEREAMHKLAPAAWKLYQGLRHQEGFEGCRLQAKTGAIVRSNGEFVVASDALVFPMIYAHQAIMKDGRLRRLNQSQEFRLARDSAKYFTKNTTSDLTSMGRKRGAYDDLIGRLEWLDM